MLEQRGIGFLEWGAIEDSAQNTHGAKVRAISSGADVHTESVYVCLGFREVKCDISAIFSKRQVSPDGGGRGLRGGCLARAEKAKEHCEEQGGSGGACPTWVKQP